MSEELRENGIEWVTGDKEIACSFSQKKYVNKVKSLAKKFPDQVKVIENEDGSVFAKLPLSAFKLSISSRVFTDEEREAVAMRLKTGKEKVED